MGMRTDVKLFTSLQVSLYEVFYSDSGDVDGYNIPKGQRLQTAQCFCTVMRFILSCKNNVSPNIWRNRLLFNVYFLPVIIVTLVSSRFDILRDFSPWSTTT